jgi:hypothetical protein
MNIALRPFSRRTFMLSGTAFIASFSAPCLRAASPRVHAIGWGRHGQRFLDAVRARQLSIVSVFDEDPARVRLAFEQLKPLQAVAPSLHGSLQSLVNERRGELDDTALLLCAPPSTWLHLLTSLGSARQLILAYHVECFDPKEASNVREVLDRFGERVFLLGFDPAWPSISLRSFFDFARSRGASESLAHIEHDSWSSMQLAALHFDFLDCTRSGALHPGSHTLRAFQSPFSDGRSIDSAAFCRFRASGCGLDLEATMEIRGDESHFEVLSESLEAFHQFAASSVAQRRKISQSRRLLFENAMLLHSHL